MFEQVKQEIDDKIKTNGNNEITATRLNDVLQDMMDASEEVIREVKQSIGDQVEANPTGEASDTLEKIKIGESVYAIPQGEIGDQVEANPTGEATETLEKIKIGETIYTAPQGPAGPQGATGATGPQGEPGEDGQDGQPGAPGPANTLSIGTVQSGQTAAANITGEAPNQQLNLVLPQGGNAYVHIKYAAAVPTSDNDMHPTPQTGDKWIGVYSGNLEVAPTAHTSYVWSKYVGETGPEGPDGPQGPQGAPGVSNAKYKSVQTLPTASADTMDFIYLTPSGTSGVYNMSYTEENNGSYSWQSLGTTEMQLNDYATKEETTTARLIQNNMIPSLTYVVGGCYNYATGNFVPYSNKMYTPDFYLIPEGATKLYYSGMSLNTAQGNAGVIFYNAQKEAISTYSNDNINIIERFKEVSIPPGAVYIKASSWGLILSVDFYDGSERLESDDIIEIQAAKRADEIVNSIIGRNFTPVSVATKIPIDGITYSAGTTASLYGQAAFNDGPVRVTSIVIEATDATTSFEFYVLKNVDRTAQTFTIGKKYLINSAIVSGVNTIDVSSYGIVIPTGGGFSVKGPSIKFTASIPVNEKARMFSVGDLLKLHGAQSMLSVYNGIMAVQIVGYLDTYDVQVPPSAFRLAGNVLYGKKYTALGDSFTSVFTGSETISGGMYDGYQKLYPYIIGNRNSMVVLNQGSSGSTLNSYLVRQDYNSIPVDVDYITIWYGINDQGHGISIGNVDDMPSAAISAETDTSTCGAFNWLFKWLYTNRQKAKIGVVITDYCAQERREAIINVCKRWGVAYLDLYDPTIPMIKTRGGQVAVCQDALDLRNSWMTRAGDSYHPSNACHEWQSTIIENFMRGL